MNTGFVLISHNDNNCSTVLPWVHRGLIVEERCSILKYTSNTFLVFVENATVGVNTVMKNILFEPEDIILHNSHTYRACAKVI